MFCANHEMVFQEPRILAQQVIWQTLKTCLLNEPDIAHYNSIFHIWSPKGACGLKFTQAVLNSRLIAWLFPLISNKTFGEKFPKLSHGDLSALPIRRIFFTTPQEERPREVKELREPYQRYMEELDHAL